MGCGRSLVADVQNKIVTPDYDLITDRLRLRQHREKLNDIQWSYDGFVLHRWLQRDEATMRGQEYTVTLSRWGKNETGEKVRVQRQRVVRSWFFAQDGGFYVQCKYGAKAIALSKDGNAIFVKQLSDVPTALQAIYAATAAGELDAAITSCIKS